MLAGGLKSFARKLLAPLLLGFDDLLNLELALGLAAAIEFDNLHHCAFPTQGRNSAQAYQKTPSVQGYFLLRTQPGYIFLSFSTLGSETFTI